VKLLVQEGAPVRGARVGILGLTFKENVPDLRNSRVPSIIDELEEFGITPLVHDPIADAEDAEREYHVKLQPLAELNDLDAVVVAVAHQSYKPPLVAGLLKQRGAVIDVKSAFEAADFDGHVYWSL
jgi:UDP-N-acetyl-D-galactosamine dehydrogenase